MGETYQLQPPITIKGRTPAAGTPFLRVNQPPGGWVDAKDTKDASVHVIIHAMSPQADGSELKLHIQTASGVAGTWTDVITFEGYIAGPPAGPLPLPADVVTGLSTGSAGSTDQLERFLRWSVDPTSVAQNTDWEICFEVWVTLK